MIIQPAKVISMVTLLLLANANPNEDFPGSLRRLPQAPVVDIPESTKYNAQYNKMALQAHNTYRRAHQVLRT